MNMSAFNFAEHIWLWGLALIPVIILLYAITFDPGEAMERLKKFADAHLLPHLVKNREKIHKSPIAPLLLWALIWGCGVLAMAGPRWSYTDVQAHRPERDMVILLDLSKSMDTEDVKPSRLMRAREEIQDILAANKKLDIAIVAFAAVPHMVVPLTSDMATIRHLLPYLDTKLVYMQGSRLKPAIEMATRMLRAANGTQKSILIISDGGFSDTAAAADIIPKDIAVYTMGVGTEEGAPIPSRGGYVKDSNNQTVIAKLDETHLKAVAGSGHGVYVRADYSSNDTQAVLSPLQSGVDDSKNAGRSVRVWDEKFWIPALAMALCMLPLFRRGYIFPVVLFFLLTASPAHAEEWQDMFRNRDQNGAAAYEKQDYGKAEELFSTPYRRGLAQYKDKKYDDAVKSFSAVDDPKRQLDATYNLGNAQLMGNHAQEAVSTYETYLKERPDDKAAKHNLDVAKKLLEQQKQKPNEQEQQGGQQKEQQGGESSQNGKQKQDQKNDQQKSAQDQKSGDGKQQSQNGEHKDQQKPGEDAHKQDGQNSDKQQNGQQSAQQKQDDKKGDDKKSTQSSDEIAAQDKKDENKNAPGTPQPEQPKDDQKKEGQSKPLPQEGKDQQSPKPEDEGQQDAGDNGKTFRQERRTPADVDADQWLSRVDSDPGPFLKKQFELESRKSGAQPEADPW